MAININLKCCLNRYNRFILLFTVKVCQAVSSRLIRKELPYLQDKYFYAKIAFFIKTNIYLLCTKQVWVILGLETKLATNSII